MKIIGKEKLTDLPHVNLNRIRYSDRQGRDKAWVYASRDTLVPPDAVVVVPYHLEEKKLVLIREYRVPLEDFQYGFPAGLVDPGEGVVQAGKRELLEETGLEAVAIIRESPPVYSSSGMTDECVSLLYVSCRGIPSTRLNEGSEEIEVKLVSRQEAGLLLEQRDIKFDVKTWIVLDRFAATGDLV